MRSMLFVAGLVSSVFLQACGSGYDQGYCIGPFGELLGSRQGIPSYEGTACSWSDRDSCNDAGGDWVDHDDTEFDYTSSEKGIFDYCSSEGFPADCTDAGQAELFMASEEDCPK